MLKRASTLFDKVGGGLESGKMLWPLKRKNSPEDEASFIAKKMRLRFEYKVWIHGIFDSHCMFLLVN